MNALAKKAMMHFATSPPRSAILYKLWAIWCSNIKIIKNFHAPISEIVHTPEARIYWISKGKITPNTEAHLNWKVVHQAMLVAPL
jgi:hypothetical protein